MMGYDLHCRCGKSLFVEQKLRLIYKNPLPGF
jgi:hypothetical protein